VLTDQLKTARGDRHEAAAAVGARAGIDTSAIYAFESGRRDPRLSTVTKWARALGLRLLTVDTLNRASAAEVSEEIDGLVRAGDTRAATRALLQFQTSLSESDPLIVAALTADAPSLPDGEWGDAIAGIAEIHLNRHGIPPYTWITSRAGDPSGRWSPWPGVPMYTVVEADVPRELRRRGILIEQGELGSA
jgi:transcriptional regulator with XRE-family HTH domain